MSFFNARTYARSLPLSGRFLSRSVIACGILLSAFTVQAGTLAYATANNSEFGTIDLATGTFTKVADTVPIIQYLATGPNNNLLTMAFDGNLLSINPSSGATSIVGPTGFADCSGPVVTNLANCELSFGKALGRYYTTDFNNNLYTVNPFTGQTTFVGKTGLPTLNFLPAIPGSDGSFDFYDENLFEAGGKLYANFDTGHFQPPADPSSDPVVTQTSPSSLYQIDPLTGLAVRVSGITFGQVTIANIAGTVYSFGGSDGTIRTLDVTTGNTTVVGMVNETVGLVSGVAQTPEPASIVLTCCGIALLAFGMRRRFVQ